LFKVAKRHRETQITVAALVIKAFGLSLLIYNARSPKVFPDPKCE